MHGGASPQAKRAAAERLAEEVDPLLTELFRIAKQSDSDAVRLAAIKDALDRAGLKAPERIQAAVLTSFTLRIDRGAGSDPDDG